MKKNQTIRVTAIFLFSLPVIFSACVKDKCTSTYSYTYFEPIYKTKEEVRANIKSHAPRELKNTGKLYMLGSYIFLNEVDKGIHVIDNSNASNPRNIAFIDIPGNRDLAIKDNILYADLYTDLVAIDVSNPENVVVKKVIENCFPYRIYSGGFYADSGRIVVEWRKKDTVVTMNCAEGGFRTMDMGGVWLANASVGSAASATAPPVGIGGSMARFTIMNNRLYTVTYSDLDVYNISTAANPHHTAQKSLGWNIETIYPFKNKLFIGSQTGMFIYSVTNPDNPVQTGSFNHVRTCDPVIADDTYAYVTLSSGTPCTGFTNELDILLLNNITDPQLLKVYAMTNPKGLSKQGNYLFICDGPAGLKVYDASNVMNLQLLKTISGIEPFDVIAYNNKALVVADDGLYQYDFSDINNIHLLSKITVNR